MKKRVRNALLWAVALGVCAFLAVRYTNNQLQKDLGSYTEEQFDMVYNALSRVYYPELSVEGGAFFYDEKPLLAEEIPSLTDEVLVTAGPSADGRILAVSFSVKEGECSIAATDWQLRRKIEGSWYCYGYFDPSGQLTPTAPPPADEMYTSSEGSFAFSTCLTHPVEDFEKNVTYWDCPLETGEYLLFHENALLNGETVTIGTEFTVTE